MENAGEAFKIDPDLKHCESNCKINHVPNSHQEKKPHQKVNDNLGHHLPYCLVDGVSLIFPQFLEYSQPLPTFSH